MTDDDWHQLEPLLDLEGNPIESSYDPADPQLERLIDLDGRELPRDSISSEDGFELEPLEPVDL